MMNGQYKFLAGVLLALALPTAGEAAVATYTWAATYQTATDSAFTTNVQTLPLTANMATVVAGSFVRFGLNVTVVGDANNAANLTTGTTATGITQPAVLGFGSFGFTLADSRVTSLTPVAGIGGLSTATFASVFDVRNRGSLAPDGSVGIGSPAATANALSSGILAGNADVTDSSQYNKLTYGVGSVVPVFTNLSYSALTSGNVTLTPGLPASLGGFVTPGTLGTPSYTVRSAGAGDTMNGPGNLTITVTVPEPASLAVLAVSGLGLMVRRRKA